jgi:hypothetical protein
VEDWDGASGNENLGSYGETYDYGSNLGGDDSATLDGGEDCGLTVRWTTTTSD